MKYFISSMSLHLLVGFIGLIGISREREAFSVDSNKIVMVEFMPAVETNNTGATLSSKIKPKPKVRKKKIEQLSDKPLSQSVADQTPATSTHNQEEQGNKETVNSSSAAVALSYSQELKHFLQRNKHYPRQAIRLKQSGVVKVRVTIDMSGEFREIYLAKASSFPLLDKAAMDLLKKLGKFKPLPDSIPPNSRFTIPIAYVMDQAG